MKVHFVVFIQAKTIENEVKTSYTTTIFDGFDEEPQEDDDSPNNDNE